jgi:hypothetical protein
VLEEEDELELDLLLLDDELDFEEELELDLELLDEELDVLPVMTGSV